MPSFRRLLPWILALSGAVPMARAQDYAVTDSSFGTVAGLSTDGTFAIQGRFTATPTTQLTDGNYAITGSLTEARSWSRPTFGEAVVNGAFGDPDGRFEPDPSGMMVLAPPLYSANLLPFGDAEGLVPSDGSAPALWPDWEVRGNLTIAPWGVRGGWPGPSDPGPADRGQNFFSGGENEPSSSARIRRILPVDPDRIDAGRVYAEIAGWFGGFGTQGDTASLRVTFLDGSGLPIESFAIGSPTAADRQRQTGLLLDRATQAVPTGAREAEIVLEMRREVTTGYNDGYADNLFFGLRETSPSVLAGWQVLDQEVLWVSNANAFGFVSPSGDSFLDLAGRRVAPPHGAVSQSLSTVSNQVYRLTFALGTYRDATSNPGRVAVAVEVNARTHEFAFQPTTPGSAWETFTMEFTAQSSVTAMGFRGVSTGGGAFIGLDQITVIPLDDGSVANPDLVVTVSRDEANSNLLAVRFSSVTGRRYSVQSTADLASPNWTPVSDSAMTGTGDPIQILLPWQPQEPGQFYRVVTER